MPLEAFFTWLVEFFDGQFLTILLATVALFALMFTTWWVYRKLSTRNIFVLFTRTHLKAHPTGWDHFIYFMKFFLVFPIIVFIGFLIFAFSLFLLAVPQSAQAQTTLLFAAIVIVSTIRIGAYINEGMAEDLAKLVPLSMLTIIFTHPEFSGIGITWAQVTGFLMLIPGFLKYLLFTVILEAMLRGGTWLYANMNVDDAPASGKQ